MTISLPSVESQIHRGGVRPGASRPQLTRILAALTQEQIQGLRCLSDASGIPVSSLVRTAIDRFLTEQVAA